jgi:hypothetical protein
MKYIPLYGEEAKDRKYVGKKWNRKFIRTIQCILNVTKGIVAPGRNFFEKAFGKDINEFVHLLYMPEDYIVYRKFFEKEVRLTQIWRKQFDELMHSSEAELVKKIITGNDFKNISQFTDNHKILALLKHYRIQYINLHKQDEEHKEIRKSFNKLIKLNPHHNLTLTYDFESTIAKTKHKAVI